MSQANRQRKETGMALPPAERLSVTNLTRDFCHIRQTTEDLTDGLSAEDMMMQSMPDASPVKWHLAHTSWFFEEFILRPYAKQYPLFDEAFCYLFNSYYEAVGERHQRPLRGLLSRPSLEQVMAYRRHVTEHIVQWLNAASEVPEDTLGTVYKLLVLGCHHEMQHQELMMTDILHALSLHPFFPVMRPTLQVAGSGQAAEAAWHSFNGGELEMGTEESGLSCTGFSYDCEGPRHKTLLPPFALGIRPVSNADWMQFMEDDGYRTATLWLSDGWTRCQQEQWQAPLYWHKRDDQWHQFGLNGLQPVQPDAPVCHISYFEADAFASWANARLPREQEWEYAAQNTPVSGNFLEQHRWRPAPKLEPGAQNPQDTHINSEIAGNQSPLLQLYGDVWEWTQSPYTAYPGFKPATGAVGEYNGKFMCGQFVLRGGSCVTPQLQVRPTYRNFFYPHQRWQFSGLRLARDL